ncbi:MAG TPA: SDR family oxidoreductase [Bacteroidota bacterium]|nr:SDR family oxidoreductase [Bacteroidota bacterium]
MERKPLALITGATSGIGFALAEKFANHGYDLVLTGRNISKIVEVQKQWEERYNIEIKCCSQDLSVSTAPENLYNVLNAEMLNVDVLVNNAGIGLHGEFNDLPLADQLAMLQVNIVALTQLTYLLLQDMLKRNSGKILNVASIAAFQPGPLMAVYYASKAYVLHFSLALREELQGTGITVTSLCPGPTSTQFLERSGMKNTHLLQRFATLTAEEVAEAGFKGLMKEKALVIPGFMNKVSAQVVRFAPRPFLSKVVKRLNQKRS